MSKTPPPPPPPRRAPPPPPPRPPLRPSGPAAVAASTPVPSQAASPSAGADCPNLRSAPQGRTWGGGSRDKRWGAIYLSAMDKIVEHHLTRSDILVYWYLCICRNREDGRCDPKRRTIAAETKLNPTSVSESLRRLQRSGLAEVLDHGATPVRNRYVLPDLPPPTGKGRSKNE